MAAFNDNSPETAQTYSWEKPGGDWAELLEAVQFDPGSELKARGELLKREAGSDSALEQGRAGAEDDEGESQHCKALAQFMRDFASKHS